MKSFVERRQRLPAAPGIALSKSNCSSFSSTSSSAAPTLLTLMLLCTSMSVVQTGPVIRPRRMMREIYSEIPDTSVQNVTTNFIDTCLYDGTQVSRVSIVCDKKPGCRAIQKTGECCPDYQCECQRNGKTYTNGEKVFDPETPCRACYCQGGEISCSQVTCYKRHDCEPKFITGRCCPEYDNCPPLESSKITEASSAKEEFIEVKETEIDAEGLLERNHPNGATSTTSAATTSSSGAGNESTTLKLPMPPANNNPLGIKIKEITKPEEIRLTDNRPKMSTTTTVVAPIGNDDAGRPTTASSVSYGEEANNLEHMDMNVTDDGDEGAKNARHTDEDMVMNGTAEVTESGESSTAGVSDLPDNVEGSSDASSPKTTATTSSTTVTESVPESSTKKENPLPAVVQIGDKLVIVDHNQPKPITVIQVEEVEGLQRGEDDISYDQEMFTDRSPDNRESSKHMKLKNSEEEMLSTQADSSVAYETIYHGGSTENLGSGEVFETQHFTEGPPESAERNDTQMDQLSASSEEFIQVGSSSEKSAALEEEHTTVNSLATASGEEGSTTLADLHISAASSEASGDEIYETQFYTEGPGISSEVMDTAASMIVDSLEPTKPSKDLPADDMTTHSKLYIEEDEHDVIQPGFQPIPEDFSLPLRDQSVMMDTTDEVDQQGSLSKSERKEDGEASKILSEVLDYRKNSTISTTEGSVELESEVTNSPSWLKEEAKQQLRAPGEPHLVPEWERNNASTSDAQFVDESSGGGELHVLKMNSEEYVDTPEGSGLSSTKKDVEATTSAPTKLQQHEIDSSEGGASESDSIKHNPKNDVESLKYDESDDSTVEDALPKQAKSSV
ncbi:uncharacterized protein LOC129729396 [Wyeomyia smithii]|uniref:uncharacterized protein LOC129729396 n=1 Tax=Wyeomyia smithii TaxID=174621 RepID=UPI00246808D1|nr:uncharacterized protein LOC129729396 [Wyeomyia smithii]